MRRDLVVLPFLLLPLQSSGSPRRFLDFADHLGGDGVAVALGRISKVTEGKRERLKDEEGELGEAGQAVSRSGKVFHRVSATGSLAIQKALFGLGGRRRSPSPSRSRARAWETGR